MKSQKIADAARSCRHNGFTLIELVVVIVILGILAATALPKFINLKSDARIAKMKGFAGALHGGIALAVAKWQVAGQPVGGIVIDGRTILFANGYPTADTVQYLLQIDYGNNTNGVYPQTGSSGTAFCDVQNSRTACQSAPPQTIPFPDFPLPTSCAFYFYAATAAGTPYTIDTSYLTTSNCQ